MKSNFSDTGANLLLPVAFLPGMWLQRLDLQQPFLTVK